MALLVSETDDGLLAIGAHVGDSRIYLLRGQKKLQRVTDDDGLLTKLVENEVLDQLSDVYIVSI